MTYNKNKHIKNQLNIIVPLIKENKGLISYKKVNRSMYIYLLKNMDKIKKMAADDMDAKYFVRQATLFDRDIDFNDKLKMYRMNFERQNGFRNRSNNVVDPIYTFLCSNYDNIVGLAELGDVDAIYFVNKVSLFNKSLIFENQIEKLYETLKSFREKRNISNENELKKYSNFIFRYTKLIPLLASEGDFKCQYIVDNHNYFNKGLNNLDKLKKLYNHIFSNGGIIKTHNDGIRNNMYTYFNFNISRIIEVAFGALDKDISKLSDYELICINFLEFEQVKKNKTFKKLFLENNFDKDQFDYFACDLSILENNPIYKLYKEALKGNGYIPHTIDGKKNNLYAYLVKNKKNIENDITNPYAVYLVNNLYIFNPNKKFIDRLFEISDKFKKNGSLEENKDYNYLYKHMNEINNLASEGNDIAIYLVESFNFLTKDKKLIDSLKRFIKELEKYENITYKDRRLYDEFKSKLQIISMTICNCINKKNEDLSEVESLSLKLLNYDYSKNRIIHTLRKSSSFDDIDDKVNNYIKESLKINKIYDK